MQAGLGAVDLTLAVVYSVLFVALLVVSYLSLTGPTTRN
jgi:hypothetical protein